MPIPVSRTMDSDTITVNEMIENQDELTDHGNEQARDYLLSIAEGALASVHPSAAVESAVRQEAQKLVVDDHEHDLTAIDDLYVIGAGKGSIAVVEALQTALDREITAGVVAEKSGQERSLPRIEVFGAGHPLPDETSSEAGERAREIAATAGDSDLVFACITGGTSAQLVAPPAGISLADLAETTDRLLGTGLRIDEINTVRKQCSMIKGGQLATAIAPATTITLVVVDEVAGEPWGPTTGDETTADDAIDVLCRHDLWSAVPRSIRTHLRKAARDQSTGTPTPAVVESLPTQTIVLADATDLCESAADTAAALGYEPLILSTSVEGESREIGIALASIAEEVATHRRPIEPPCVLISGGETTVNVADSNKVGEGGPNQEFALSVADRIAGRASITVLAMGTDGTDGPTDIAGGLIDGTTVPRLRDQDVDVVDHLRRHAASDGLQHTNDAIYTGPTETNLMDLRLFLVEDTSS